MIQFLAWATRSELEETQERLLEKNITLKQKMDRLEQKKKGLEQQRTELEANSERICRGLGYMPRFETKNTYFLSHYQEEGATLGKKLKTSIEKLGGGCWLDVNKADGDEKTTEEGIQKQGTMLVIASKSFFTCPYCTEALEWAVQMKKPMIVVVSVEDKNNIGAFMKTVPLHLKNIGKINWIDLNCEDEDYWDTGIQKILRAQPGPLEFAPVRHGGIDYHVKGVQGETVTLGHDGNTIDICKADFAGNNLVNAGSGGKILVEKDGGNATTKRLSPDDEDENSSSASAVPVEKDGGNTTTSSSASAVPVEKDGGNATTK